MMVVQDLTPGARAISNRRGTTMRHVFRSSSETSLREYSGKEVEIVRELEDGKEVDRAEVGRMFLVRVVEEPATTFDVFADELTPTPTEE